MIEFIMSPTTFKLLKHQLPSQPESAARPTSRSQDNPLATPLDFNGIRITINDLMPDRNLKEKWIPPPPGKFTELTESDEPWARPLGLGKVVTVDLGPLIYQFKNHFANNLFAPSLARKWHYE